MTNYDFVVIGAGSAGCVIANRLTENPDVKVLLIESGLGVEQIPENVWKPFLWYTLLGSEIDWKYQTVPQPGLRGRQINEPRGKLVGGSSNLYLMMHIRGHPYDFDNWAYQGATGWSYQEVLPYFKKLENQEDQINELTGQGGPLHISYAKLHDPNPTSAAFIDACLKLGYPFTENFNGLNTEGVGWHHVNIKDGKRHSIVAAYLLEALQRPNLTLSTNSHGSRLLFEGKKCIGVEYIQNGEIKRVHANHEVIVCAGAIESPKILLVSGIGNPLQLKQYRISLIADVPGVGENFHNHVLTGLTYHCSQPVPAGKQNLSEAALFVKSDPGWLVPDLQIAFVHIPFKVGPGDPNCVSIIPGVVRPLSRGWIRLQSDNPLIPPLINPNYLSDNSDVQRMIKGVKLSREILKSEPLAGWCTQEITPGLTVKSDRDLEDFVRTTSESYHHQSGSCKMGSDNWAVVDPQLRVYGVSHLRVADASVMPSVPSGNCHAAVLMIAEKVSDLIKKDYGLN